MDKYEDQECNKRLIEQIAIDLKVKNSVVEHIIYSYTAYIANTMKSGTMEGVCVPYLGKFQVKMENQQYKAYLHQLPVPFKQIFQNNPPAIIDEVFKYDIL